MCSGLWVAWRCLVVEVFLCPQASRALSHLLTALHCIGSDGVNFIPGEGGLAAGTAVGTWEGTMRWSLTTVLEVLWVMVPVGHW